jgi:hypothetical protein
MPALLDQDGGCPIHSTRECAGSAAVTGPAGPHGGAQRKKASMMTDVACFCGCCFSFDGGAAACPRCGEVASVTAGLALEDAGRSQPRIPVTVMNGNRAERANAGGMPGPGRSLRLAQSPSGRCS